jgi:WD40 repeat protein
VRKFQLRAAVSAGEIDPYGGPVISPDGARIVYPHEGRLWIRELASLEAQALPGTEAAERPFWSSAGNRIGFFDAATVSAGVLWTVSRHGGPPTYLGTMPLGAVYGSSWSDTEEIVLGLTRITAGWSEGRLFSVSARGGSILPLVAESSGGVESGILFPHLLPDQGTLLVVEVDSGGTASIAARRDGDSVELLRSPGEMLAHPVYSAAGFVVFQRGAPRSNGIWAFRFDSSRLRRTGEPFLVSPSGSRPSVSADGTLVFHGVVGDHLQQLVWVDRAGSVLEAIGEPRRRIRTPRLSPDGRSIAFSAEDDNGNWDIWARDLAESSDVRLTLNVAADIDPAWSPDGSWIAFASRRSGQGDIYVMPARGRGTPRQLTNRPEPEFRPEWEPRGESLLYHARDPGNDWGLWRVLLDGESVPLLREEGGRTHPSISPDGRFLAYLTEPRTSRVDIVFMTRLPSLEDRWQISENGSAGIRWNPRGDEILYIDSSSDTLMAVPVQTEPDVLIGPPEALFPASRIPASLYVLGHRAGYDVSPDGERFVVIRQLSQPAVVTTLIENWHFEFAEAQ